MKNIRLKNEALSVDYLHSVALGPGDSFSYSLTQPILTRTQNHATVTAEPSKQTGDDLPYQDVSDTDPSEVAFVAMTPGLEVSNTVRELRNSAFHLLLTST